MDANQLDARASRVRIANKFLDVIANHGNHFFAHNGSVSRFEMNHRGRIWFVDSYSQRRIYTHQNGSWGRYFTNGGTLLSLCKALRDFILARKSIPLSHLGPWPETLCGGDLWGYGDSMQAVRDKCAVLVREVEQMTTQEAAEHR